MIQRLLLNRVHAETAGSPVRGQDDLILQAFAHETKALLPFLKFAKPRTEVALDPAVIQLVPVLGGKSGWGIHRGFLQEALHSPIQADRLFSPQCRGVNGPVDRHRAIRWRQPGLGERRRTAPQHDSCTDKTDDDCTMNKPIACHERFSLKKIQCSMISAVHEG
jgi:hypothetical protein